MPKRMAPDETAQPSELPKPVATPTPTPTPKPIPSVTLQLNKPLRLSGDDGSMATLVGYTVENISESPGDAEAYPSGSGVVMNVVVNGFEVELSDLSTGYEGVAVAWTSDHRITLLGHNSNTASVNVQIEKITDKVDRVLHKEARIDRSGTLGLQDSLTAVFAGHSHKTSKPGGPSSPLIVSMSYQRDGQDVDKGIYNLYPKTDGDWKWRNFKFTITDSEYGKYMKLDVVQLALQGLSADTL